MSFERVLTIEQVELVVKIANVIWTEHYTPIIGAAQVEYMLHNLHSFDAINSEVKDECVHYYLIYSAGKVVGYAGIKLEDSQLFLSKIYVHSGARGCGIGKRAIEFIKDIALENSLEKIYLTVNKNNTESIGAYQTIGFNITDELCMDIGEGYVMDDYKMELVL